MTRKKINLYLPPSQDLYKNLDFIIKSIESLQSNIFMSLTWDDAWDDENCCYVYDIHLCIEKK